MRTHEELVEEALRRPGVKNEYDALAEEYRLAREKIVAYGLLGSSNDQETVGSGTNDE